MSDQESPPIVAPPTGAAQPVQNAAPTAPPDPPRPPDQPAASPIASLLRTRKGLAVVVSTIVVTGFAIAVSASYFQGKLSPTAYFDQLKIAGGALVAAWGMFVYSATAEDVSKNVSPNEAVKAIVSVMADMHAAQSARADAAMAQQQAALDAIRYPYAGGATGAPSKPPPAGPS